MQGKGCKEIVIVHDERYDNQSREPSAKWPSFGSVRGGKPRGADLARPAANPTSGNLVHPKGHFKPFVLTNTEAQESPNHMSTNRYFSLMERMNFMENDMEEEENWEDSTAHNENDDGANPTHMAQNQEMGNDRNKSPAIDVAAAPSNRRRLHKSDFESESDPDPDPDSDSDSDHDSKKIQKRAKRHSKTRSSSSKRRRSRDEDERRRHRREKRRREEKKERRMREKDKERKRKKREEEKKRKAKKKKKKKEKEKGKKGAVTNLWGKYGIIRETDMWNKRPEFTAWLSEVKKVNLESLANWEEKQLFKDFMEDHNTATFPSKKYYNLDAYFKHKMEKEMKKGFAKMQESERTVFNDEEQRRLELQKERERQKEEQIQSLQQSMQPGMAQAMKEQAQLREEMAYQYKLGNFEAAAAIQRRLDPDVAT
ncbi:trichohyalin-like [Salvia splendens]|uniref:trichohyalin-like n=1 Tax=Salvia splendens TaxID=180675 RepID=UPI001C281155|nr:trichohyalin-like [Salvia splendens]